jgi:hypothetical protein
MRKLFALVAAGAFVVLGAGQASAASLASANLSFAIGTLPAVQFPALGATGTATSNLSASLSAGTAFNGTTTVAVTDPSAVPITAIQAKVTSNGALNYTGAGSTIGQFKGVANVKGFGGLTLLGVPLQLGDNATVTAGAYGINITAISGDWTVGATTILTPMGATGMATGSNGLAPNGVGTLTLVNPVLILSNLSGGTNFPAFAVLTLNYVPEPGTLLLLGSGVAGLAALGRRRVS